MRSRNIIPVCVLALFACASTPFEDDKYIVWPSHDVLQGKTAADDKPFAETCEPRPDPSPSPSSRMAEEGLKFQCYVHTEAQYRRLMEHVDELEKQLSGCQQSLSKVAR